MKIRGAEITARATRDCIIPRGGNDALVLRCEALPLDYANQLERLFPDPVPPREFVRDNRQKIVRDPETKVAIMEENVRDPDFVAKRSLNQNRQSMYLVWFTLRGCADVEFETPKTHDFAKDPVAFVDALWEELKASGFSLGDVLLITQAAMDASNVSAAEVEKARASFLGRGRPDGEAASDS